MRSLVKDLNENTADGLALRFGIGFTGEGAEEFVSGTNTADVEPHVLVVVEDLLEFVLAQKAVVHENAMETIADGSMEQLRRDRAVNATRKAENDRVVADFRLELGNGFVNEIGRSPVARTPTNVHHKILQQQWTIRAVPNLRMELNAPHLLVLAPKTRMLHVAGRADHLEIRANGLNRIAMRHPHLRARFDAVKQVILVVDMCEICPAIFAGVGSFNGSPVSRCEVLRTVTNAEDRHLPKEGLQVRSWRLFFPHAVRRTTENHPFDIVWNRLESVPRNDFRVDIQFSDAPSDELGVLRPEVENQYALVHGREGTLTSRAMLFPNLQGWKIVLGSGSPRRRELVGDLDLPVEVRVREIEEVWPDTVAGVEVAEWLAREKAAAQIHLLLPHELLITGDTVVVLGDQLLEKPADASEAFEMLRALSGRTHTVASGLAVTTLDGGTWSCLDKAQVTFANLPDSALHHYIERYKPFDKAGAYGIQEWIGAVGVSRIEGSFYSIMGLPVHRLFEHLQEL